MSQSELRNFEKSMAYHLAPAMLGIKPACLMSMEKNKDGLEENVELFNSRAYTKGMKLTVLCECKSRKLLFLYNEKLLSDRLADNRVRKLLESFGYDSCMTLEQQLERLSGRISASEDFLFQYFFNISISIFSLPQHKISYPRHDPWRTFFLAVRRQR